MADTNVKNEEDITTSLKQEDVVDANKSTIIKVVSEKDILIEDIDEKKIEDIDEKKSTTIVVTDDDKTTTTEQLPVDPNFVPKDYTPKIRGSVAETVDIPAYNPNRRLSKIEMDDMKQTLDSFTKDLIKDPAAASKRYTLEMKQPPLNLAEEKTDPIDPVNEQTNDTETEETKQNAVPATLQSMMQRSRPTVRDVFQKKVTWREFLGVYNVLRIGIAALFAVLLFLSIAALAYILNPNTCKKYRIKAHRIQWHPIANALVLSWVCCLVFTALFKIFGREILWTHKKINKMALIVCSGLTVIWIIRSLIYDPTGKVNIMYLMIVGVILTVASMVYMFVERGFYLIWLMTPFMVVMVITFGFIAGTQFIFRRFITPESALFGTTYMLMMTVLETIVLKFTKFTFPYTWGRLCTCPCNKNKFKSKLAKNYEEEEVSFENELSDLMLFYISMLFMVAIEAVRVTGYVLAKDDIGSLVTMVLWAVLLECISRNNLSWEFIYRVILKKELPGWGRVYAIWYGAKYQGEYIPIWCVLFMNLVNYGPFKYCGHISPWTENNLADNVNLEGKLWLFGVLFGAELLADIASEIVLKMGRYYKWFGVKNEKGEDPPRKKTLVKVNLFPMMWILVHSYIVAFLGFHLDHNNRTYVAPETMSPTLDPTPSPLSYISYT